MGSPPLASIFWLTVWANFGASAVAVIPPCYRMDARYSTMSHQLSGAADLLGRSVRTGAVA